MDYPWKSVDETINFVLIFSSSDTYSPFPFINVSVPEDSDRIATAFESMQLRKAELLATS